MDCQYSTRGKSIHLPPLLQVVTGSHDSARYLGGLNVLYEPTRTGYETLGLAMPTLAWPGEAGGGQPPVRPGRRAQRSTGTAPRKDAT